MPSLPDVERATNRPDRPVNGDAARMRVMQRWERQRSQGRSSFVWRNGVVGWGFPAAALTAAYKIFQEQGFAWSLAFSDDLSRALVLIAVAFPMLGAFFGLWLWTQGEARYARLRDLEQRRERVRQMTRGAAGAEAERRGR